MPARDEDLDVSLADDREASRKARDVLDLGTPPYSPTSHEARVLEQHEERRARQPPKIRVERGRGRQFAVVPDHPDRKIGNAALMSSVGTASAAFMTTILGEIANLTATDGEADERRFQAALALVQGVQPRDGTEAMLAVQMAAVHSATMKMAARMARTESKEVAEI